MGPDTQNIVQMKTPEGRRLRLSAGSEKFKYTGDYTHNLFFVTRGERVHVKE